MTTQQREILFSVRSPALTKRHMQAAELGFRQRRLSQLFSWIYQLVMWASLILVGFHLLSTRGFVQLNGGEYRPTQLVTSLRVHDVLKSE